MTPADDPLRGLNPANRNGIYADLHARMPVYWSTVHAAWIVTRYDDVNALLRHQDALPLQAARFVEAVSVRGNLDLSSLLNFCRALSLMTRPPRHDAIRRVLAQALAGIRHLDLPTLLDRQADRLLAAARQQGVIDLAEGYGRALAVFVIGSFLGIPEADLPTLSSEAAALMAIFERTLPSVGMMRQLNRGAGVLTDYFRRLIAATRRRGAETGLALISELAHRHLDCDDDELAGYCVFFFIAAGETTAAAIAGAALIVLQSPPIRAHLVAVPERLPHAARELLRLVSPVQYIARRWEADIHLASHRIAAGEPAMLMLGAANRDPAAYPDPDRFDLDRAGPEPLAFAAGPYRCIGAALASFEVELAVRKLLRWPALRLSSEPPEWTDRMNIAPLRRLPAQFG